MNTFRHQKLTCRQFPSSIPLVSANVRAFTWKKEKKRIAISEIQTNLCNKSQFLQEETHPWLDHFDHKHHAQFLWHSRCKKQKVLTCIKQASTEFQSCHRDFTSETCEQHAASKSLLKPVSAVGCVLQQFRTGCPDVIVFWHHKDENCGNTKKFFTENWKAAVGIGEHWHILIIAHKARCIILHSIVIVAFGKHLHHSVKSNYLHISTSPSSMTHLLFRAEEQESDTQISHLISSQLCCIFWQTLKVPHWTNVFCHFVLLWSVTCDENKIIQNFTLVVHLGRNEWEKMYTKHEHCSLVVVHRTKFVNHGKDRNNCKLEQTTWQTVLQFQVCNKWEEKCTDLPHNLQVKVKHVAKLVLVRKLVSLRTLAWKCICFVQLFCPDWTNGGLASSVGWTKTTHLRWWVAKPSDQIFGMALPPVEVMYNHLHHS